MNRIFAYSLVEALIALSLLVIGIASATLLVQNLTSSQEAANRVNRALNVQEQAARLYQLGLSPATITNILPENFVTTTPELDELALSFSTTTTNILVTLASGNTTVSMERAAITVTYPSITDDSGSPTIRSNSIIVVRPGIR